MNRYPLKVTEFAVNKSGFSAEEIQARYQVAYMGYSDYFTYKNCRFFINCNGAKVLVESAYIGKLQNPIAIIPYPRGFYAQGEGSITLINSGDGILRGSDDREMVNNGLKVLDI